MDTLSATHRASSPIVPVPDPPSPARPIVSSEWLRRKPSSSGRPRNPSGARKLLDGASRIRSASFTDRESSSADSDGEIGVGVPPSRRRSKIGDGAYDVKILCLDRREEGDEMKWEVSIRRRRLRDGEVNGAPSSPLQLSTNSSIVQAPSSASSINLSLSLDQPTGKLVFIAFPMDLHATPTRRKAKEKEKEDEKEKEKQKERDSPQPRPSTPPPAPNLANSPTTPSSRKKGATSMWPSPSKNGVGRSRSPASPRDMFTPRRTRIVSAAQLDGGLYARGTVDGMSEELENELRINGDRK